MDNETKKQTASNPIEHVASGDCTATLLQEFDRYSQGDSDCMGSPFRKRVLQAIKESKASKAKIVMDFANMHVGAFDSGFVDGNTLTVYDVHRSAQNYVRDTFQVNVQSLSEEWGELTAKECRYGESR